MFLMLKHILHNSELMQVHLVSYQKTPTFLFQSVELVLKLNFVVE